MAPRNVVRTIYLYLVTVVGIVMALTGLIGAITSILNLYVFRLITPDGVQNELASVLGFSSAVLVGAPVWLYHWNIIQETRQHVARPSARPSGEASDVAASIPAPQVEARRDLVRRLYIYLLCAIGLFIVMFNLVNIAPNIYRGFFMSSGPYSSPAVPDSTATTTGNTYAVQSLIRNIVAVLVGIPVWLFHWHLGQREERDLPAE
ncbi:MAG: DUF5671 domain-containing protein [Candidatus Cryosericum sp.]|nr:DUF5671 domain-containing protein [bacterium]